MAEDRLRRAISSNADTNGMVWNSIEGMVWLVCVFAHVIPKITRPLVCSLSLRVMENDKRNQRKKSIYTVAVSLPP
jgi:hypothetical protein